MRKENDFLIKVLLLEENAGSDVEGLNFKYLQNILTRNNLVCAFCYNAERLQVLERIPFNELLHDSFQKNLARNVKLEKVYTDVALLAGAEAIDLLPLKGINLLAFTYPHPGMRILSDIDVFCRGHDYPRLKELLLENGFICRDKPVGSEGKINHDFEKNESWGEAHIALENCKLYCTSRETIW